MKQGIHPDYHPVVFEDSSTGYKFLSGSTATSSETVKWEDGNEYPLIRVEVTSDSHPFYTGKQSLLKPTVLSKSSTRSTVSSNRTSYNSKKPGKAKVFPGFCLN